MTRNGWEEYGQLKETAKTERYGGKKWHAKKIVK
jgi:hypothetical protein